MKTRSYFQINLLRLYLLDMYKEVIGVAVAIEAFLIFLFFWLCHVVCEMWNLSSLTRD